MTTDTKAIILADADLSDEVDVASADARDPATGRWRKGQSGNPKGQRPQRREIAEFKAQIKAREPRALARLDEILEHGKAGVALQAIAMVLAYLYGKPREMVEVAMPDDQQAIVMTPLLQPMTAQQWIAVFRQQQRD